MLGELMRKMPLISLIFILALSGAGCARDQVYLLGNLPTEQQLSRMDDAFKIQAIGSVVSKTPLKELSEDEKHQELKESIDTMMGGTAERLGDFTGTSFSQSAGSARIVKVGAMYRVVLSEEFSVNPGPSLMVKVGDLEVAKLKSIKGTQTFDLPKGFDLARAPYVSIYCQPFQVEFARASFN